MDPYQLRVRPVSYEREGAQDPRMMLPYDPEVDPVGRGQTVLYASPEWERRPCYDTDGCGHAAHARERARVLHRDAGHSTGPWVQAHRARTERPLFVDWIPS